MYSVGTAMWTQSRRLEVVANNMANINTSGYKSDLLVSRSFRDEFIQRVNDPNTTFLRRQVGPYNYGIHVDEVVTSHKQGMIEDTGIPSHLGIEGAGFFAVETPDGVRYTRNGSFEVAADGTLTTSQGYPVIGEDGPVVVNPSNYIVNLDGTVYSSGVLVNTISIFDFADRTQLRKQGDSLINAMAEPPIPTGYAQIHQYSLETSNVDVEKEMAALMEITRSFEANQRALRIIDETLGKAVNNIANV